MNLEKNSYIPQAKKANRPDRLKAGDAVKIINIDNRTVTHGIIVFETNHWREVQIGSEFKTFDYYSNRFFSDAGAESIGIKNGIVFNIAKSYFCID